MAEVARDLGVPEDALDPRGRYVAKLPPTLAGRRARGRLVLVTAITPTSKGEGKTLTTVGLAQALRRWGVRAAATLRQPSLGPLLGGKGGAAGGGRAQVEPAQLVNLHLTGDIHAVVAAQDTLAALADAHVHHGKTPTIDRLAVPRALDVNDRALRRPRVKDGDAEREVPFVIAAASESMAVLSLARSYADLRARLGRIVVGRAPDGAPVTAEDVGARGACAAILRDALSPNLLQTTEGAPVLVHAGPFGNVSHGHNSVLADEVALSLADVVVTEAGFATELGAEKYVSLVHAAAGGAAPSLAVLVVSVRALAAHGAASGARGDDALAAGLSNLDAHLRILRTLGLPAVVALNRFADDADPAVARVLDHCAKAGVAAAAHTCFADGAAGGEALARLVLDRLDAGKAAPRAPYPSDAPLAEKLRLLATRVYGAEGVDLDPDAQASLAWLESAGFGALPPCVAKTALSISDDAKRGATPTEGWRLRVRDLRVAAGAGYVVALAGDVLLMPGLGAAPAAHRVDLLDDGTIVGV
ncbi:MAG TPA: formate--tetrahydrofolate ligase [Candidatus Thermoplasmatota archaeon]|nr:formate--tetrahydrofolate ligase [Candidatus Thermoplasmatota archaeon]